ncbi:hypothetical protein [Rhodopila sp.]|uniref:hypothetical protein n=1 Tax=Rhodopila sp. TaxID=2480087 RepID=UPI003D0EAFD0
MPRIPDDMLDCVVYLYRNRQDAIAGEGAGGCGFLITLPNNKSAQRPFVYVVTNKHIALEFGSMRLNTHDGKVDVVDLDAFYWTHHDDHDDVSICPIGLNTGLYRFIHLSREFLVTRELIRQLDIGIGDDTFTVGRVVGSEGKQRNLPAARFGNIAQMPGEKFLLSNGHLQESFLVKARSISGFSGSPVFIQLLPSPRFSHVTISRENGGAYLLGINWGHLTDWEKVRDKSGELLSEETKVKSNVGMMLVVPAWKLAELIDSEKSIIIRNEIEAKLLNKLEKKPPSIVQD